MEDQTTHSKPQKAAAESEPETVLPSGSLSWTQELPTKSGTYYWAYQWGTTEIEVCHVIADGHNVMAFDWHEDMRQETPVGMWQGWWAGPFDPPIPKWTENVEVARTEGEKDHE